MDTKIVTSTEQKVFWSKSSIASFAILVQTVFLFDGCLLWLSNFVLSFSFSHKSRKRNGVKFSKTGPSKVCGRQPLKNYTWSNLKYFAQNAVHVFVLHFLQEKWKTKYSETYAQQPYSKRLRNLHEQVFFFRNPSWRKFGKMYPFFAVKIKK